MTLSCPVCHDIILVTEHSSCTPCGHVFHESCLNKWLTDNRNCPHCRQPCTLSSTHRLYLPESHFEKSDIMEKLTEVAIAKESQEKQIKDLEKNNKKLEFELKVKKKQYQKMLNRSRRIGKHSKTINIPRAGQNSSNNTATATTSSSSSSSTPVASTSQAAHNESPTAATTGKNTRTTQERTKRRRNSTRVNRAKEYFRRKKAFFENTTNNNNQASASNEGGVVAGSGNVITI